MKYHEPFRTTVDDLPMQIEHGMRLHVRKPWSVLFAPPGYSRRGGSGAMFGKNGQLERVGRALASGLGIRAAARKTGAAKGTVAKLHRILLAERAKRGIGPFLCPCGQPSTHCGWCSHRYQQSPARQAVMTRLHRGRAP